MTFILLAIMTIFGRHNTPLYHAEIPENWQIQSREELLEDTTLPIASFQFPDLTITIHNFPNINIPPQAQVDRWIKQLGDKQTFITPTTHSGFVGLILESDNLLAAAFQLAPHYKNLQKDEKTSDWTIKATGSIHKYRKDLLKLIHSFETLDPLTIN